MFIGFTAPFHNLSRTPKGLSLEVDDEELGYDISSFNASTNHSSNHDISDLATHS
jgi:hypothetical protein